MTDSEDIADLSTQVNRVVRDRCQACQKPITKVAAVLFIEPPRYCRKCYREVRKK
jgi:hypothetical protein